MKRLNTITLLALFLTLASCAQNKNQETAPKTVQEAFNKKFTTAKKVTWSKENDTEWEAEFKMNRTAYSANFSTDGEWLETEYRIKNNQIPQDINALLDSNFSDYDIEAAEISETPAGKSFEFGMEIGEQDFEVVIDPNGKITKTIEKDQNDTDED